MPCADSSTICARRQVTTDPLPRRMIRTNRPPSSSPISRTRSRSLTGPVSRISAREESPDRANVSCYGTRSKVRLSQSSWSGTRVGDRQAMYRSIW